MDQHTSMSMLRLWLICRDETEYRKFNAKIKKEEERRGGLERVNPTLQWNAVSLIHSDLQRLFLPLEFLLFLLLKGNLLYLHKEVLVTTSFSVKIRGGYLWM